MMRANPDDPVARTLRDLLEARSVTRAELAHLVGVSTNTVSNWTQGVYRPARDHARRIAEELGITVDDFLGARSSSTAVGHPAPAVDDAAREIVLRLDDRFLIVGGGGWVEVSKAGGDHAPSTTEVAKCPPASTRSSSACTAWPTICWSVAPAPDGARG